MAEVLFKVGDKVRLKAPCKTWDAGSEFIVTKQYKSPYTESQLILFDDEDGNPHRLRAERFEKVEPMSEFAKDDVLEYIHDHAYSNAHTGIRKGDKIVVDRFDIGPNAGIQEGSVAFNIAANSWQLPAKYFKKATIDTFEVGDLARYRFDYESRGGNYIKKGDLVKIVARNDFVKAVTICKDGGINYCYRNFAFDKITKDTPDETFAPGDLIEYWGPPNNFGLNHDSEVEFKPLGFKEWITVKSVHLDPNTGRLVINFTKDGIPRSYFAHDFMMAPTQAETKKESPIMQVGYNVTPETNKGSAMYQIDLKDLPEGVTADQFVEKMKQEFMKRKPSNGTTRKEPPAWLLGIVTFITTVLTGLAYQYFTK